jgi:formate-dependent phosphoribosylglycinamide formyltransferase (GAR transformylase)
MNLKFRWIGFILICIYPSVSKADVCAVTKHSEELSYFSIIKGVVSGVTAGTGNISYGANSIIRGAKVYKKFEDQAANEINDAHGAVGQTIELFANYVADGHDDDGQSVSYDQGLKSAKKYAQGQSYAPQKGLVLKSKNETNFEQKFAAAVARARAKKDNR